MEILKSMGKELPERGPKEKLPKSSTRGLLKEENREYSRVEGLWPVSIDTALGPIHGEVKNISLTGALILAPDVPGPNQSFKLAIDIPEYDYAILATAQMVRLEFHNSDDHGDLYGVAVRLLEMSEEDRQFLVATILS